MKKILITGSNGYIGTSFKSWVSQLPDKFSVEMMSLRDEHWKSRSFEGFDVLLHAAAIVHSKGVDFSEYLRVNRDLTEAIARKAKQDGVKHFIFLSTMGIYGVETGVITADTLPSPKTPYAKSKLEAENLLVDLESDYFRVAIIRPPIVYGNGSKGNYERLARLALKLPIFPNQSNKRSMIYIDNLSEFITTLIKLEVGGLYFPQNKEYVNTTDLVRIIAQSHGKLLKTYLALNWFVKIGLQCSSTVRKVFGSFIYDKKLLGGPESLINGHPIDYETVSFEDSIRLTEGRG